MANIALYPGGYKPPHIGHYKAAKIATEQTDKVIVFVGPKEREGITQDMSVKLWTLYTQKDPIEIRKAGVSPVRDVYDFVELEAKDGDTLYFIKGEKDSEDPRFARIPSYAEKFNKKINIKYINVPNQLSRSNKPVSGTSMRNYIKNNDKESFIDGLPLGTDEEAAWNTVTNLEEDLYNPEDKVLDYMKSSEFKAGYKKKNDIPRAYKYKRGGMYTGGGMGFGGMYEDAQFEKGKVLHVYDFDDTIAKVKANIRTIITSPSDPDFFQELEIPSTEFPEKSKELEARLGNLDITYDFKEFEKQIGDAIVNAGVVKKLKNSLSRPDIKTTILTARSIGHPVTRYMREELGLSAYVVPLGMQVDGKVRGIDKANWIEDHIKKGYQTIYFIDDSEENRVAVASLKDKYPNIILKVENPSDVNELMYGMMTEPEKKKHAKNLKRLSKDLRKQGDQYMKVPDYLIGTLTRKYYERVGERKLTKGELKDKERIFKDLKKNKADFKKRYGKDAEAVMYATATARAKKEGIEERFSKEIIKKYKNKPQSEMPFSVRNYLKAKGIIKSKKEGMYPPYKADQVQKVRYQASDTFTNSPKQAKKMGYLEGDTYEKMAAKGKKKGTLKQGTVRKRLRIKDGEKIPLSKINKAISSLKKRKSLSDKDKKYLKALNLAKTLKTTTNLSSKKENIDPKAQSKHKGKSAPYGSAYEPVKEVQAGTGEIYVYNEIGIKLKNHEGQVLPGDVIRAPKGFPLGGKKLEKSLELKVTKNSRKGINKYRLSLEDPKTGKKYSVMNFKMDGKYKGEELPQWSMVRRSEKNIEEKSSYVKKHGKDPVKGTGKKPKGSGRRLYTDENPSDTVKVKFSTRQDIIDTLNKASFKAKPHKRQSQIINLIHQRVRAALNKAKDPAVKKRLRSGFEYIKKRKEASKKKTQRMRKEGTFTKDWWKEVINEILITEGGAAGHMAHPFNLPNVNNGKQLLDVFEKSADSLDKKPGAIKIDGVNASIRLVDLDGKKQFVMDRGSKKELDLKGITKDDLLDRFGKGHGMVKIGGEVLDLFNEALPAIQNDLKKLGAFDDPNILFNMEYVSGKTNVQDYGANFIAIHGLNKIESKEVQGKRGPLTKRVSLEVPYSKDDLQSLLDNLKPTAKKRGYEVYGSVPTEMKKKPNFNSALSKNYTVNAGESSQTKSLGQWLNELSDIPETDFIFMNVGYKAGSSTVNRKKVGAVSKQVYLAILNKENIDGLFDDAEDRKKAVQGFVTYLATEKLGDEVLKVLDSPMGSADKHEGVVIRDESIAKVPFKITGKFILGGMASDF